jgi:hypothetical protein
MTKKAKFIIYFLGFLVMLGMANFALAQDFGVNAVNNGLAGSLSMADPRVLVGRIIQIVLSFLGTIALLLIIYAGFIWMTSSGDEEKIGKAKKILTNALIGLIIILSSWAITTFIISRLAGAINGTGGNDNNFGSGGGSFVSSGTGAIGSCSVESVYPINNQQDVPRNISILITFKEPLKLDSVCINEQGDSCACNNTDCNRINPVSVRLFKTDLGDACSNSSCPTPNSNITDIVVSASGDKTLILMPVNLLGESSGFIQYTAKFTSQVKKINGDSMFDGCGSNYVDWNFTVSNKLDLTPPIVVPGMIFPIPDNEKDLFRQLSPALPAQGAISVKACPEIYTPAQVESIVPSGPEVTLSYHGQASIFKISIPADAPNRAQLFDGLSGQNLLGVADFNDNNEAIFDNYFIFKTDNHPVGSSWTITVNPEVLADTLTVNSTVYTFSEAGENNNIQVPSNCDLNVQAANITAKLSGRPDVEVDRTGSVVNVVAKVAGSSGNNIVLATNNPTALLVTPLSGGSDRQEISQAKDQRDRPMNSAIQMNFNEPINPLTVSGLASEVADYIRVVNADPNSGLAGSVCSSNIQCRSYKCEASACVGNYLGGKFAVSNGYKTVEFISDVECGINGCGEKIYCLPANSHLSVELVAANLKPCVTDNDCASFQPFTSCQPTALGYKTCQNIDSRNYPTASPSQIDGIVDAAVNSLDGDRSAFSDGPLDFYNDNYQPGDNENKKDKYKWSFYVNDQIALDPPQIIAVSPAQGQANLSLADPIEIRFNTLMMNSTLRSGSVNVVSGTSSYQHKLINLRSSTPTALGYWILNDNIDVDPLDGEPDLTIAKIFHTPFAESVTFTAQVGSGVKDIYQNCYKPSAGPGCIVTAEEPSCCFGTATGTLDANGNCQ